MNIVEPIHNLQDIKLLRKILSENQRNLLLFSLGINSGLRISDILALNVEDVKNKKFIEIREIKTNKYKRFPINKFLQSEIEQFVVDRNPNEPLFLTQKNKRLDRIQAYKILNKATEEAGINIRIGTHSLRKTFGYHHYKKFGNLPLLQKILNHSSSAVTLRYIGLEQDIIDEKYKHFGFDTKEGNIFFDEKIGHFWFQKKCTACGASKEQWDRDKGQETHAYNFIHCNEMQNKDLFKRLKDMKFDVIIENPPYQLSTGGSKFQAIPL